ADGHDADERELDDHDRDDGAEFAEDESVRAQRRRRQLAQHPVATIESGGDGLAGEPARGQAQAQRTGNGDVERVRRGVDDVETGEQGSLGQEDEQTEGEDDRQQQLFAVAEDGDGLELRLRHDAAHSHRRGLPVRSKKTSARDWACMSISVISRPASATAEHAAAIWAELGALWMTM